MHCTPPATIPVTTSVKYVLMSAGIFLAPIPLSSPVDNIPEGWKRMSIRLNPWVIFLEHLISVLGLVQMLFVVHAFFFPARTAEMKHVHRLKLKEIQWKTETQFEAANVEGQEIFCKTIMPHRKINMQLRGNDTRVMGNSRSRNRYHSYFRKSKQ